MQMSEAQLKDCYKNLRKWFYEKRL
jgi:hypothetical protein